MDSLVMNMQQTTNPLNLHQYPQKVHFTGHEEKDIVEIFSPDVTIIPSSGNHESGSSKITLKNIVDFNWELRFYTGQLLAVHIGGKYVAYGIKTVGKNTGLVRVVNRATNERILLKGMAGMVLDIAFAHIPTKVVLACVDEFGNLLVHEVEETDGKINCSLLLHVEHGNKSSHATNHRVIWCPYVPEDDSEANDLLYDDVAKLLVLTHDSKAELWNIGVVTARYGVGPLRPENIEEGYLEVLEHSQAIIDAAFSPDGTALATASLDGNIKFFQVYMHNGGKPRCLHHWQPHGGKPLSALFFLDNHRVYNPDDQFWKFAVTGADNNSELKIWSCESWTCLQTIRFKSENSNKDIVLKAGLDLGAGYLLLSDIYNRLLYILQISKDKSETKACVSSVCELLLPYPILSFGIVDAGIRNAKSINLLSFDDVEDIEDDQAPYAPAVVIRMYLVQPKSLQECHIAFGSPVNMSEGSQLSSLSKDSLIFQDGFSDMSINLLGSNDSDVETSISDIPTNHSNHLTEPQQNSDRGSQQQQLNLMTPDVFSSPAKKDSPTDILNPLGSHYSDTSPHVNTILDASIPSSPSIVTNVDVAEPLEDDLTISGSPKIQAVVNCLNSPIPSVELQENPVFQREGFASGGSSPSREVQEIFSLKSPVCINHNFYDDKNPDGVISNLPEPGVKVETKPSPLDSSQFEELSNEKDFGIKSACAENDGWPQIPIELVAEMQKSVAEENNNKRNSTGHSDRCSASSDLDTKNQLLLKSNQRLETTIMTLTQQISSFINIMQEQQSQIKVLQEEVQVMQQSGGIDRFVPLLVPHLEKVFMAHIDKALAKHTEKIYSSIQEIMFERDDDELERKRQEVLMSAISQTVGNLVSAKLEEIVCEEIQNNIIPAIVSTLDPLKHQLHNEMTQKLTSTDHLLKENIAKLVHSKSVMDVLGNSIVSTLQPTLQSTYKEMFALVALPSFEKACQTMFQQINETFSKGTKEYVQSFDSHFDKQRRQQEKGKDVLTQIQSMTESLRSYNESIPTIIQNEAQSVIQSCFQSMQEGLNKAVTSTIKEQIAKGFRSQQSVIEDSVITAVRSRAVTPAPHILDVQVQQAQIVQLINQGKLNSAFQQALSASDLNLVVFICERVNPHKVFAQTPCPLQQPVLLSLIQQLSADMSNHTEVKYKYLEGAVTNLETNNLVTREHLPVVINSLQKQLSGYIANNPNNELTRSMKMLHLATQALITQ